MYAWNNSEKNCKTDIQRGGGTELETVRMTVVDARFLHKHSSKSHHFSHRISEQLS